MVCLLLFSMRLPAPRSQSRFLTASACDVYAPPGVGQSGMIGTKNLPRDLTSFVGRRRELGEVREAMSSTPLLTLIGPAGVGRLGSPFGQPLTLGGRSRTACVWPSLPSFTIRPSWPRPSRAPSDFAMRRHAGS